MSNQQEQERDWRIFDRNVDLYKFYIDLILKSAIFVFGVTGALISYTVGNILDKSGILVSVSLFIPLILNAGLCLILYKGTEPAEYLKNQHENLSERLNLEIIYEFETLTYFIKFFKILYGLITMGLAFSIIFLVFW